MRCAFLCMYMTFASRSLYCEQRRTETGRAGEEAQQHWIAIYADVCYTEI